MPRNKPIKTAQIGIRVSPKLMDIVQQAADEQEQSVTDYVTEAIKNRLRAELDSPKSLRL